MRALGASRLSNPAGSTPITVTGSPSRRIERPTSSGSAPKRVRQSESLKITTGGAPRRSSAGSKSRPIAGATPSTRKNGHDTRWPSSRSAGPSPVRIVYQSESAATWAKDSPRAAASS